MDKKARWFARHPLVGRVFTGFMMVFFFATAVRRVSDLDNGVRSAAFALVAMASCALMVGVLLYDFVHPRDSTFAVPLSEAHAHFERRKRWYRAVFARRRG